MALKCKMHIEIWHKITECVCMIISVYYFIYMYIQMHIVIYSFMYLPMYTRHHLTRSDFQRNDKVGFLQYTEKAAVAAVQNVTGRLPSRRVCKWDGQEEQKISADIRISWIALVNISKSQQTTRDLDCMLILPHFDRLWSMAGLGDNSTSLIINCEDEGHPNDH